MGLFDIFNRQHQNGHTHTMAIENAIPDIPETTFIEKDSPEKVQPDEKTVSTPNNGIHLLYDLLDRNYESKGYNDALINPDTTHLDQNVIALKNDLERSIRKVKTFYEDFIRQVNFHISSRSRSGMIETVEELTVKKEIAESHIRQVQEIEEQAKLNEGVGMASLLVIPADSGMVLRQFPVISS